MKVAALASALALALCSCSRPEPPRVTPVSASLISISTLGMDVNLKLDAENPNDSELSARSLTAKVTLDGKYEVGTVNVPSQIKLPPKKKTRIDVPASLKWSEIASVAALATQKRDVPFQVDGTMAVGGESLHLDVPFHLTGLLTHDQIVKAAISSIPKIPGIPALPGLP